MGASLIVSTGAAQTFWNHGGYITVPRGTPIILTAQCGDAALNNRYTTLRQPGAAAGYQVTAGLTLFLTQVIKGHNTQPVNWLIGSGTTDVGINSAAAPAGEISEDSQSTTVQNALSTFAEGNALWQAISILIDIAAARFPFVKNISAASMLQVQFIGHEE